jgi:hypothetical protein
VNDEEVKEDYIPNIAIIGRTWEEQIENDKEKNILSIVESVLPKYDKYNLYFYFLKNEKPDIAYKGIHYDKLNIYDVSREFIKFNLYKKWNDKFKHLRNGYDLILFDRATVKYFSIGNLGKILDFLRKDGVIYFRDVFRNIKYKVKDDDIVNIVRANEIVDKFNKKRKIEYLNKKRKIEYLNKKIFINVPENASQNEMKNVLYYNYYYSKKINENNKIIKEYVRLEKLSSLKKKLLDDMVEYEINNQDKVRIGIIWNIMNEFYNKGKKNDLDDEKKINKLKN